MAKKETKKNKRRRKIFLSLIMILFVGIVLTASTYAWFSANRTVSVQSIDVNVSTSQGLQISTDATNWKAIINNDDITGATWNGSVNQLPTGSNTIVPVSTVGTIDTNGFMEMYRGSIETSSDDGSNILVAEKSTETRGTAGDFIAFDVFIQSSQAQTVYLTSNSSVVAKGTSTGIENSARVAFITQGSVPYGSAPSSAWALKGNTAKWIWEPNTDVHTAAGVSNALNTYHQTVTEAGAEKLAYKGVKAAIPESAAIPLDSDNSTYFSNVTTVGSVAGGIPTNQYLTAFDAAEGVTKVRIYMWIEGQDVDAEDRASGGALTYSLQFSIDSSAS